MLRETQAHVDGLDHVVVLMLENRSFDHMLGYLALDDTYPHQIEGLRRDAYNMFEGHRCVAYEVDDTEMEHWEDPGHDGEAVQHQLAGGGAGYVTSYVEYVRSQHGEEKAEQVVQEIRRTGRCPVMGYHGAEHMWAFDLLARHFAVCDHYFCSVPGATMPNRLYALTGTSAGRRSNRKKIGMDFPLYNHPSIARVLDTQRVDWACYHHNTAIPANLRLFDAQYRKLDQDDRFRSIDDFRDDARAGRLPAFAWIEPSFFEQGPLSRNDDHPPVDLDRGQRLVADVSNALMTSAHWESTLLVVTYDEHGGFYDHVVPGPAEDDHPDTRQYGPRVPTLLVSPMVPNMVASDVFDHTSILRTVLDQFCPGVAPDILGRRVQTATGFGHLLTTSGRAPVPLQYPPAPERVRRPARPRSTARAAYTAMTIGDATPRVWAVARFDVATDALPSAVDVDLDDVVDALAAQFGSGENLARFMGSGEAPAAQQATGATEEPLPGTDIVHAFPGYRLARDSNASGVPAKVVMDLSELDELQQGLLLAAVQLRAEQETDSVSGAEDSDEQSVVVDDP